MNVHAPVSRVVRYVYSLRLSVIFWLALPFITAIDSEAATFAPLRAIFTHERPGQLVGSALYVVCCGWVALLLAPAVSVDGVERLPPAAGVAILFKRWLGEECEPRVLLAPSLVQAPNIYLIAPRNAHEPIERRAQMHPFEMTECHRLDGHPNRAERIPAER